MTVIDKSVIFQWQASSYFGWGIYGLNLLLNWRVTPDELLVTSASVVNASIAVNPVEWRRIQPALQRSAELHHRIRPFAGGPLQIDVPVLHALGNDFMLAAESEYGVKQLGAPSLGIIFCESTEFSADARERAKAYPLIVAGSRWNRDVLANAAIGSNPTACQPCLAPAMASAQYSAP